MTGAVAEF